MRLINHKYFEVDICWTGRAYLKNSSLSVRDSLSEWLTQSETDLASVGWLRVRRKALNLNRAAVPIEFCYRVPASLMRYRAISTGVYSGLPRPSDGDCRVMITAHHKPAFAAFVNTNGERHLLSVAAITANLARVSWINSFNRPQHFQLCFSSS